VRSLGGAFAIFGFLAAFWSPPKATTFTILIGGDLQGYLSPCGCVKPMTGGIRRQASAIRLLRGPSTLVLENGVLNGGIGQQNDLKADAAAQALVAMQVDAIHLSAEDALAGEGRVRSMLIAGGGRFMSTNVPAADGTMQFHEKGSLLVGAISMNPDALGKSLGREVLESSDAVATLLEKAKAKQQSAILMIDGGLVDAKRFATDFPQLRLIAYRTSGEPASSKVGHVWLVSPGDHGKYLSKVTLSAGAAKVDSIALTPEFDDDPKVDRVYRNYLKLVDAADLLAKVRRSPSEAFAGSAECIKCHAEAGKVWEESEHAHALTTLETDGHGRDPECVPCHVVGLDKKGGFESSARTPQLSHVGCESCHGPGAAHSAAPATVRLPKVGANSCTPCHKPDHSPGFDFATYWARIKH